MSGGSSGELTSGSGDEAEIKVRRGESNHILFAICLNIIWLSMYICILFTNLSTITLTFLDGSRKKRSMNPFKKVKKFFSRKHSRGTKEDAVGTNGRGYVCICKIYTKESFQRCENMHMPDLGTFRQLYNGNNSKAYMILEWLFPCYYWS